MPCMQDTVEVRGAFCYAKDSGNFGCKSNGKVRLGSSPPEYLRPLLDVIHFDLSAHSVHCLPSFHLFREFGKGITNSKSHCSWLARFDRKIFHFSLLFPLVSDRSVWLNEKHPKLTFGLKKL